MEAVPGRSRLREEGEIMERGSIDDFGGVDGKKKGGERDQRMGCDSEGGLFLLCCLTWGDVEHRRDRVRWNDGCYKEPGWRRELRVQFTAGLALKGVGSFSYVITEEKGDRMDGARIHRQPPASAGALLNLPLHTCQGKASRESWSWNSDSFFCLPGA